MKKCLIVITSISLVFVYSCSNSISDLASVDKQASGGNSTNASNVTSSIKSVDTLQSIQLNSPVNNDKTSSLSE